MPGARRQGVSTPCAQPVDLPEGLEQRIPHAVADVGGRLLRPRRPGPASELRRTAHGCGAQFPAPTAATLLAVSRCRSMSSSMGVVESVSVL